MKLPKDFKLINLNILQLISMLSSKVQVESGMIYCSISNLQIELCQVK